MQISQNAAKKQNTVNRLNQLTDVNSQLKEAERLYNLNKKLYADKAIGSQEYKRQRMIIITCWKSSGFLYSY